MNLYQKLLSAGILVVAVAFFAVGGTGAFFSDSEVSAGNTFAAGSVDVSIESIMHTDANGEPGPDFATSSDGMSFTLSDLKPLDEGTIDYDLENNANPAFVCAAVSEAGNAENDRLDQETEAGDTSGGDPGNSNGELQDFLSFKFGGASGSLADISGQFQGSADEVENGSTTSSSLEYCFGEYDGSGNCALSSDDDNVAQTDSVDVDVTFEAIQQRNNEGFTCDDLNDGEVSGDQTVVVNEDDLATTGSREDQYQTNNWLFYNDTNDTLMEIDEFSSDGGENHMDTIASVAGAKMLLDNGTASPEYDGKNGDPRYNIATYAFRNVALGDISSLKYRVYRVSGGNSSNPYFHFNVDFDNSDSFQNRLVHVPGASGNAPVSDDTWTEVDAINSGNGMWFWSGGSSSNRWPAETGTQFGDDTQKYQTWDDIVAAYPNAETRDTDAFLGVRVGQPGPIGEEGYVDYIEFDGTTYDFEL